MFSRGKGESAGKPGDKSTGDKAGKTGARSGAAGKPATPAASAGSSARDFGPYDVSEAPAGVQRVDLGSLQLPSVEGVEVRVAADNEGRVQQVLLVDGASALQLGVFAAPRSEGIWDEVRAEIAGSLMGEGAQAEEVDGEYGTELRARVRSAEGVSDIRFVGVDGPRWMVRAVYQGAAATDPNAGRGLTEVLHGLVVDRGKDAFPVREALPLRLPRELAEQAHAQAHGQGQQSV
jgi:Protein of unknown function (DUF3710)